jgi:3-oxoacyl-[acyl-carrier protein] reductase
MAGIVSGKVAIVTGAGRGIGRGVALLLAREGARVVVCDIGASLEGAGTDAGPAQAVVDEIRRGGGEAIASTLSIAEPKNADEIVAAALTAFGRVDILVNNAGMTHDQLLVRMTDEDWDRVMEVNLRAAFLMTRAVTKALVRGKRGGRIINISSTAGAMGNAGQTNYAAAKAGLIGFTKAAARELAHWSILVNAVAPGLIETDMTATLPAAAREALLSQVPLKRSGTAREVAEMVRFLAGDGATYITGQVFHVNGGLYM